MDLRFLVAATRGNVLGDPRSSRGKESLSGTIMTRAAKKDTYCQWFHCFQSAAPDNITKQIVFT
jgi:hypothetical protein